MLRSNNRDVQDRNVAIAWANDRQTLSTSFGDIAYVDRGRGPAALFLHGFPLNGFQWNGVIGRLTDIRRCIAPDALGLGYTKPRIGQGVGFHDQVAMLLEMLDRFEIKAVDIVANDSGTGVAQLLAAEHPTRVRSLLLTNGDTEPDTAPAALLPIIELGRAGRFAAEIIAANLANAEVAHSPSGLGGMAYTDPLNLTDAAREMYLAPLLANAERMRLVDAYATALAPNPLAGMQARLREVRIPARIVWGMGDIFFSPLAPGYLAWLLPGSRGVRVLSEAKLFFPEEFPDVIAEEARALWSE